MTTPTFDVFSRLYAVVLHHWAGAGARVRWSPSHKAWLCSAAYGPGWAKEPGNDAWGKPDAPSEDDRAAAAVLAQTITGPGWFCQRCGGTNAALHFIAPDIERVAKAYCVQVPAYSAVESSGGGGSVKHSGSTFGCQSVDFAIDEDAAGPQAAYVYGRPLPADEVIDRAWCSRCSGVASNVRFNAGGTGESASDRARDRTRGQVRRLIDRLAE